MFKPSERTQPFSLEIPDYVKKMEFARIETRFVAIMDYYLPDRQMVVSPYHTRCIQKGEIHELVYVAENHDSLINLNNAWYLGFVNFCQGGVLAKGMTIEIDGHIKGQLLGFDETHFPNHLNLIISAQSPKTGKELGLKLNDICEFFYL